MGDKMKKIIPFLFLFFLGYAFTNKEEILIPDYAIRFRVIANSNTIEDQTNKILVKNKLETKINDLMLNAKNSEEATKIIQENLSEIRNEVDKISQENKVSFGMNYFPEKIYKGVKYPSGNYQSLVVTLGNGSGNNWWCVMFPPLCLLDAKEEQKENVEYRFYVKDVLEKYFS